MLVKFDTILLPAFYFLVHISRRDRARVSCETLALFAVSVGLYLWLGLLFPAPMEPSRFTLEWAHWQIVRNFDVLRVLNVAYPPLLVHAVPVALALVGLWRRERFLWASVLFAAGMSAIWFAFTNYSEVRAHYVVLVLVMPAALLTLRNLLEPERAAAGMAGEDVLNSARS